MDEPQPGLSPVDMVRGGTALGTWNLDPATSTAQFAVKHFWGLVTVRGVISPTSGHARVADDGAIAGSLVFDATSVNTRNRKRDQHLRSDDFFDADDHPTVEFSTSQVDLISDSTLRITGDLTAAGHTNAVTFDAVVAAKEDMARVDAEFPVDRTTFDMTWSPLHTAAPTAQITLGLTFVHADGPDGGAHAQPT